VIIVGHTGCGGALACLNAAKEGQDPSTTLPTLPASAPLNQWLAPLTSLAISLHPQLAPFSADTALPKLVEANVRVQVDAMCASEPIVGAWADAGHRPVWVHGWVYELENGRLKDLQITRGPPSL